MKNTVFWGTVIATALFLCSCSKPSKSEKRLQGKVTSIVKYGADRVQLKVTSEYAVRGVDGSMRYIDAEVSLLGNDGAYSEAIPVEFLKIDAAGRIYSHLENIEPLEGLLKSQKGARLEELSNAGKASIFLSKVNEDRNVYELVIIGPFWGSERKFAEFKVRNIPGREEAVAIFRDKTVDSNSIIEIRFWLENNGDTLTGMYELIHSNTKGGNSRSYKGSISLPDRKVGDIPPKSMNDND